MNFLNNSSVLTIAHAFGKRYELPIPLPLFVFGGAGIVLLTFFFVLPSKVANRQKTKKFIDEKYVGRFSKIWAALSITVLLMLVAVGLLGSQEIPENILPTVFWLIVWIFVPLSCGILGDWTKRVNPFSSIATITDNNKLRLLILNRPDAMKWPARASWWPAAVLYFALACGELIYNQTATLPAVIAATLLGYFIANALLGLIYGKAWLLRGEVFSVLFATWGRMGYFRFGEVGIKGFGGGLGAPFEAKVSRVVFVLLLLVSVSFDGLLATPTWSKLLLQLPESLKNGSLNLKLAITVAFLLLGLAVWALFTVFAVGVARFGGHKLTRVQALARLLPSLLPISFGYLLAHNIEYLVINGQLLFPLIGNPTGKDSWPLHLPYPFNDSFEPNTHLFPSAFYWYVAVTVIILVHIAAVIIAHRYLANATRSESMARRSEYPWIVAMVAYTMLSLWLLAQPLVKEGSSGSKESAAPSTRQEASTATVHRSNVPI